MRRLAALSLALVVGCSQGERVAHDEPAASSTARTSSALVGCGALGQPDCPLQGWMKANCTPAVLASDFGRLDRAFDRVAAMAPPGFDRWTTLAGTGKSAALAHDLDGVRRACKACHDDARERYRRERRTAPLP